MAAIGTFRMPMSEPTAKKCNVKMDMYMQLVLLLATYTVSPTGLDSVKQCDLLYMH